MKNSIFLLLFLAFLLSHIALSHSEAQGIESRIALVIGNNDYDNTPLINPVNDARAIAEMLEKLGFVVTRGENLSQKQMREKIFEFGKKLEEAGGIGLFYFAGHGVQVKGQNYLIPIGSHITHEGHIQVEGISVDRVMVELENARNHMNIVILDACRNNPFAVKFRSTSRGLASIDVPYGSLVAYATAPGKIAQDGEGGNGLYTGELIRWMGEPGLKIEDVFKRVRTSVRQQSNGDQIPWESSSLEGDFYFNLESKPKIIIAKPEEQYTQSKTQPAKTAVPNALLQKPVSKPVERAESEPNTPPVVDSSKQDEVASVPDGASKSGNKPLLLTNEGYDLLQRGQYNQSIEVLTRAIELDPGHYLPFYYRGTAYLRLNSYKNAIDDLKKSIEINPNNTDGHASLGFIYLQLKDYEQAIEISNRSIELNPNDEKSYINRGMAYNSLRNYQKALSEFKRAIEINPRNSNAYFQRGHAYRFLKEYRNSLEDFNKGLELDPSNEDAKWNMDLLRKKLNK